MLGIIGTLLNLVIKIHQIAIIITKFYAVWCTLKQ